MMSTELGNYSKFVNVKRLNARKDIIYAKCTLDYFFNKENLPVDLVDLLNDYYNDGHIDKIEKEVRDFFKDYTKEYVSYIECDGNDFVNIVIRDFNIRNRFTRTYTSIKDDDIQVISYTENPYMCYLQYYIHDDNPDNYTWVYGEFDTDEDAEDHIEGLKFHYVVFYLNINDMLSYKVNAKSSEIIMDSYIF